MVHARATPGRVGRVPEPQSLRSWVHVYPGHGEGEEGAWADDDVTWARPCDCVKHCRLRLVYV